MMRLDAMWNCARADLVVTTGRGDTDLFLWEHTTRVARGAQQIAKLPAVQNRHPDEEAIVAAALYHDAGWVTRFHDGEIDRREILLGSCPPESREQATVVMKRSLGNLLPSDSLERASHAIRALNNREIDFIEGQIIYEADNLDGFGLLSLWLAIRRGTTEGKGVQSLIDKWRRQKEYQYWAARLKDSFRFAPVRELARKRLEKFERFMEELEEQHLGLDLEPG